MYRYRNKHNDSYNRLSWGHSFEKLNQAAAAAYHPKQAQSEDHFVKSETKGQLPDMKGATMEQTVIQVTPNIERARRNAFSALQTNPLYKDLSGDEQKRVILKLAGKCNDNLHEVLHSYGIVLTDTKPYSLDVPHTMATLGLRGYQHIGRHWRPG